MSYSGQAVKKKQNPTIIGDEKIIFKNNLQELNHISEQFLRHDEEEFKMEYRLQEKTLNARAAIINHAIKCAENPRATEEEKQKAEAQIKIQADRMENLCREISNKHTLRYLAPVGIAATTVIVIALTIINMKK